MKKRILVIEDEKNIVSLLTYNLSRAGYDYDVAYDGEDGLNKAISEQYDLILLDIMLPKMDGYEVCREIRKVKDTPIIMATAKEEEADKIYGLNIGADDYVTKPFSLSVLLARINSNIRRFSGELSQVCTPKGKVVSIGELVVDFDKCCVSKNGVTLHLSKKEYEIVSFLAENRGKVFSREDLLTEVWGYDNLYCDKRTVDVTISRIRQKIENDPDDPKFIITKSGMGYFMN
ncbi:MAG: response regulator transcription factor [Clostridia bacterium]|nr:response regulator transcription factor [Clostridia bacterium]